MNDEPKNLKFDNKYSYYIWAYFSTIPLSYYFSAKYLYSIVIHHPGSESPIIILPPAILFIFIILILGTLIGFLKNKKKLFYTLVIIIFTTPIILYFFFPNLIPIDKYSYLYNESLKNNDISICDRLAKEYDQRGCYFDLAKQENNETMCNLLKDYDYSKVTCYELVARSKNNISICNLINSDVDNQGDIDQCILYTAQDNNKSSYCYKILGKDNRNICLSITTGNKSFCQDVSDSMKSFCE